MTDDPAWIAWRLAGITATDIAKAVTDSYGGAYAVYWDKHAPQPNEPNQWMQRGHRWEQRIADTVTLLTGLHVVGEQAWCQHQQRPEWRATIDGLLANQPAVTIDDTVAILEIKTRAQEVRRNWDYWMAQTQWQMLVTSHQICVIAELVIDDTDEWPTAIHIHRVEADPDIQAQLIDVADRLTESISTSTPPAPTSPDALDISQRINNVADPAAETVDLTDIATDVERWSSLKTAATQAEAERKTLEAAIRDRVGKATRFTVGDRTWSVAKPKRIVTDESKAEILSLHPYLAKPPELDTTRARKEVPDLYAAHQQPVGARIIKETTKT